MSNLGSVLKNEITRLARKEIRAHVDPVRRSNTALRREIAELKRQVAQLSKQASPRRRAAESAPVADTDSTSLRFGIKGLKSLRARLGLSAAEFGKLAGVSGQSIYNWEAGKAVPRRSQLATLAGLRSMGKREARARLSEPVA